MWTVHYGCPLCNLREGGITEGRQNLCFHCGLMLKGDEVRNGRYVRSITPHNCRGFEKMSVYWCMYHKSPSTLYPTDTQTHTHTLEEHAVLLQSVLLFQPTHSHLPSSSHLSSWPRPSLLHKHAFTPLQCYPWNLPPLKPWWKYTECVVSVCFHCFHCLLFFLIPSQRLWKATNLSSALEQNRKLHEVCLYIFLVSFKDSLCTIDHGLALCPLSFPSLLSLSFSLVFCGRSKGLCFSLG